MNQDKPDFGSYLSFDELPRKTKLEFLLTLKDIQSTKNIIFKRFFERNGCVEFLRYYNFTVE